LTCFIHTADWQIGMPYRQIANEQKRFKLQQQQRLVKLLGVWRR